MTCEQEKLHDLVNLFNQLFENTEQTRIVTGGLEPFYQAAAKPGEYNLIISNQDFVSSALHEIAHWCIAGTERRKLNDYGYWYRPDGRTEAEQNLFEQVEIKPQALEWLFSTAASHGFSLSADNLNNPDAKTSDSFRRAVAQQAKRYVEQGLPDRAARYFCALQKRFGTQVSSMHTKCYDVSNLN